MHNIRYFLLLLFSLTLVNCSSIRSTNTTVTIPQTNNANIASLKMPPGMSIPFDTLYPVPEKNYPSTKQVDITPPALNNNLT